MPSIPTPADRAFEALQDTARHLLASNSDPDEEIAWYVHAPGAAIRVKTIGLLTPFLTFTTPDEIQLIIAPEALILDIATRHFFVETLDTQNSDRLDFHDVAVWAMRAALEAAYEAGRVAGAKAMLAAATHR